MVSPNQGSPVATETNVVAHVRALVSALNSAQKASSSSAYDYSATITCTDPSAALALFDALGLKPAFDTRELAPKVRRAQAHLRRSSLSKAGLNPDDSARLITCNLKLLEDALSDPAERKRLTDLAKRAPPPAPPKFPEPKLPAIDRVEEAKRLEREKAAEEAKTKLAAQQKEQQDRQAHERAKLEKQLMKSERPSEKEPTITSSGWLGFIKRALLPSSAVAFAALTALHAAEKPLEALAERNPTVRSWLDYTEPVRSRIKPVFQPLEAFGSWTWEKIKGAID